MIYDFCIIGGGIVGLATAMELLRLRPGAGVIVLEKEQALGLHQTGHNSGVIHAGVYYKPGSLKADLCKRGAQATKDFCDAEGIAYETRGKMIVATSPLELKRMELLHQNSLQNGIEVEELDAVELHQREPNVSGIGALFIPQTGIVDYRQVCDAMGRKIREAGGEIIFGCKVESIRESGNDVSVVAGEYSISAKHLIACAGLQSDRLAKAAGLSIQHQVVPFRGEYYEVAADKRNLVHHLIYPVPDPDLPFLGIHLTPMIDGSLTVGPNAVLGFAREGYPKFSFDRVDVMGYARFPGFWKLIRRNWRSGMTEWRNSLLKSHYLEECRKYSPSLEEHDLLPREAGIRAQAVMNNGDLVHDFLFLETPRMLHVCNAPSPAATSAIPIGQMIAAKATAGLPAVSMAS